MKNIERTCENCWLCELVPQHGDRYDRKCRDDVQWWHLGYCHAAITDEDIAEAAPWTGGKEAEPSKTPDERISDSFREMQNILAKIMPQPTLDQIKGTKTYQQSTPQEQQRIEKEHVKLQSLHRSSVPSNGIAGKTSPSRIELLHENNVLKRCIKIQLNSINKRFNELEVANKEIELLKLKLELADTERVELQETMENFSRSTGKRAKTEAKRLFEVQEENNQLLKEVKAHEKENTMPFKELDAIATLDMARKSFSGKWRLLEIGEKPRRGDQAFMPLITKERVWTEPEGFKGVVKESSPPVRRKITF